MFDLKGKVALVTGAASGIGFAFVKELLRNELKGVTLVDIDSVKGQQSLDEIESEFGKGRAMFVKCDVCDKAQLEEAFKSTIRIFSNLDIVINNAGIFQERSWEKCIAVNLMGVVSGCTLASEEYLPKYKSGLEAVIVNTSSAAGLLPFEEGPIYSATKSAIIAFTRAMGGEVRYERTKVRILAVCPGFTDTDLAIVTNEQLNEPYLSTFQKQIEESPSQTTEVLSKHVMEMIRKAPTGSVWLATGGACTQVKFQDYSEHF